MKAQSFIRNLSIRTKILGLGLIVGVFVAGVSFVFFYNRTMDLIHQEMVDDNTLITSLIASRIEPALVREDKEHVKLLVEAFRDVPQVRNAQVLTDKKVLFAEYVYDNQDKDAVHYVFDSTMIRMDSAQYFRQDEHNYYFFKRLLFDDLPIGMLAVRVSKDETNAQRQGLHMWMIVLGLCMIGLGLGVSYVLQRVISQPILAIAETAQRVTALKDYSLRADVEGEDEIGQLCSDFNEMLDQINQQNLEIQELNAGLERKVQDRIAEAVQAKDAAEQSAREVEAARANLEALTRELERKQRFDAGLAEFADILRERSDEELAAWGDHVLHHLVSRTGAVQAALYTTLDNETDHPDDLSPRHHHLQLTATYAHDLRPQLAPKVPFGVGLVGQAAKSQQPVFLNNLGDDSALRVRSALAQGRPSSLIIMPLVAEHATQGVLELTALQPFDTFAHDFLSRLSENIAATLLIIKSRANIQRLLAEAQTKNQQLTQQEEELRQNIDELQATQREMRRVEQELRMSEEMLRNLNENLENLVSERTKELQQTLESLQATQQQLVESEKMASLGQLVAGIAHEINTPIGAVKASAVNMDDTLPLVLQELPTFGDVLQPHERELFSGLLRRSLNAPRNLSSKEERKYRKALFTYLEEQQVTEADDYARKLVESGIYDDIEAFLPIFQSPNADRILDLLYKLGQLKVNLDNIMTAAEKTKKIVFALKNYAHKQNDDTMAPANLQDSLDVILTLYANQIKYGTELVTNFDDVPPVLANIDEIGQVWTNIIHNALQAMNYEGRLEINLFEREGYVVVQIIDNGPGIPPDIKARIFDPFFTTKKAGEGTGLGLDIVRKIVEKHNGAIRVESEPGRTMFEVTLPVAPVGATAV